MVAEPFLALIPTRNQTGNRPTPRFPSVQLGPSEKSSAGGLPLFPRLAGLIAHRYEEAFDSGVGSLPSSILSALLGPPHPATFRAAASAASTVIASKPRRQCRRGVSHQRRGDTGVSTTAQRAGGASGRQRVAP